MKSTKAGGRAGGRRGGWWRGLGRARREEPARPCGPCHPCPVAADKRPPTPFRPRAPSEAAARLQGCITWSPRVKWSCQPQVHGLVPKQGSWWGDRHRPGVKSAKHEEKTPNSDRARSARVSAPFLAEVWKRVHANQIPNEQRLRGGRAPAPRVHPARPRPGGQPAGGRERAPGPRSPSCLPAAPAARGAGGDSRGVPDEAERSGPSCGLSAWS